MKKNLIFLLCYLTISVSLLAQEEDDTVGSCIEELISEKDSVFTSVEQMPQFPEGDAEMLKYINRNIKLSHVKDDEVLVDRVLVRFIVRKTGLIDSPKIIRGDKDSQLAKNAIELVLNMPKWSPAMQNGIAVDVYYYLPIHICLRK